MQWPYKEQERVTVDLTVMSVARIPHRFFSCTRITFRDDYWNAYMAFYYGHRVLVEGEKVYTTGRVKSNHTALLNEELDSKLIALTTLTYCKFRSL